MTATGVRRDASGRVTGIVTREPRRAGTVAGNPAEDGRPRCAAHDRRNHPQRSNSSGRSWSGSAEVVEVVGFVGGLCVRR